MIRGLLDFKKFYLNLKLTPRLGYAYFTKTGAKGFVPLGRVPAWKCNAIQVAPGDAAVILDIDVRHGVDGHASLPCAIPEDTPVVQTQSGQGRQYWFTGEPRLHTHADNRARIDVLTGNTGIFVPPSKIEGGGEYLWLVPLKKENLRTLPEELVQFLLKLQTPKMPAPARCYASAQGNRTLSDLSPRQRDRLFEALDRCRGAAKGGRSEADFRFMIWGLSCGLDDQTLWGLCGDTGKFKQRGLGYFRFTLKNALRKLGR